MPDFPFHTTRDFDVMAVHLEKYCRIARALSSKRLHELKAREGLHGGENVIFDFSGGVHLLTHEGRQYLGTLTTGGAGEIA